MTSAKTGKGRRAWAGAALAAGIICGIALTSGISYASQGATARQGSPGTATRGAIPLAGVTNRLLKEYGIQIAPAPANSASSAVTSKETAIKIAEAQPINPSSGVRQAVLAEITFTSRRPVVRGLYWVISLKPTGDVPIMGGRGKAHPTIRSSYYVIFIKVATGRFYAAIIG